MKFLVFILLLMLFNTIIARKRHDTEEDSTEDDDILNSFIPEERCSHAKGFVRAHKNNYSICKNLDCAVQGEKSISYTCKLTKRTNCCCM